MHEFGEHAIWSALIHLAEPSEDRQLVVGHAHVRLSNIQLGRYQDMSGSYLVRLDVCLSYRLQLSCRNSGDEAVAQVRRRQAMTSQAMERTRVRWAG